MQDAGVVTCARHPGVETALACGRCGTPICPRCLVYTPGGTRCPDCAQLRRPPMYELRPMDYARAALVALLLAPLLGVAGALLLPPRPSLGLFALLIAAFGGWGAGTLVAEAIARATSKRGTHVQVIAGGAIVLAAAVRLVLAGAPWELLLRDFAGALMVLVALSAASGRLR